MHAQTKTYHQHAGAQEPRDHKGVELLQGGSEQERSNAMIKSVRHFPEGSKIIKLDDIGIVIVQYHNSGAKPCVKAYRGRAAKPMINYYFPSLERREQFLATWIEDQRNKAERRAAAKAARQAERNQPNALKVGSILYNSWGYEQTNVDFYEVVESKGQTVKLREVAKEIVGSDLQGSMSDHVVPVPGSFIGEEILTKRVRFGTSVSMDYGCCSLWDGRPKYRSWYY